MYNGERQPFLCLAGYRPPCLRLRAFHSTTGKQLWLLCPVAGKAIFMAAHQRKPSTPSPGRVYALDPQTGSVLWQKHFPSELVPVWAATDAMVYAAYPPGASFAGMLHALDERSGSTIWMMPLVSGKFNKERGKKCRATT